MLRYLEICSGHDWPTRSTAAGLFEIQSNTGLIVSEPCEEEEMPQTHPGANRSPRLRTDKGRVEKPDLQVAQSARIVFETEVQRAVLAERKPANITALMSGIVCALRNSIEDRQKAEQISKFAASMCLKPWPRNYWLGRLQGPLDSGTRIMKAYSKWTSRLTRCNLQLPHFVSPPSIRRIQYSSATTISIFMPSSSISISIIHNSSFARL